VGEGGSNSLFDPKVEGVKLIGRYGSNAEHVLFFIVEADDWNALQHFLLPGFRFATATITPVSELPVDEMRRKKATKQQQVPMPE
jgi:hypothetical protein